MANTPRDLSEILDAVRETHRDIDPTIDITKGPMSVLLYTFSSELTRVEQHTSYLTSVYQLEIANDLDDDDIENLGRNYGRDSDVGANASVIMTFYRYDRPEAGQIYVVDEGTLVSTNDARYVYALVQEVRMVGDSADVYYNADRRRYEVNVSASAIAIGVDYNLPEETIDNIVTDTSGFDGAVNLSAAVNGRDPLGKTEFRNQIWEAVQGLNSDIAGYFATVIFDNNGGAVDDIAIVPSSDLTLFKRYPYLNEKMGYDIYIITNDMEQDVQTGTALGGETKIVLDKKPVLSVETVFVDGQSVPFEFVPDSTPAFQGSPQGNDHVLLDTALTTSQVYEIRYFYYAVIYNSFFSFEGRGSPFGTEVLPKRPQDIPIYVAGTLRLSAIYDREEVINDTRLFTTAYLNDPTSPSFTRRTFYTTLDPVLYRDAVVDNVGGVASFTLTNFVRVDSAVNDIEVVEFDGATELPVISELFDVV